ncbi:aminoglycoside phosphotransferase family protein [Bacillus sp. S/N-304-OC-R1]|uniref:aminoglycoside phosphotransferase family protein n=1 Tax=Bacillus sp. S/N-304-OC-R1 TaxID=2758034 RepID=UPI001C8DEB8A|nr:aminoglycoside phosphotransferase family protein [Bacillus sp. S/N-304-OC-R1]MBY0122801.1 aminoglycoside phosphotransferase family protein [Bacillus sp. S/N-304-OC-R1]
MEIEKIITNLVQEKIIQSEPTKYEQLKGGTVSELYLLCHNDSKYVVKLNDAQLIQSEAFFLGYYKESNLLPRLLYVEPSYRYIVYSFITGSTNYVKNNKKDILNALVQGLLNHYKKAPNHSGWGWADDPADSWERFLNNRVLEARKVIDSRLTHDDHSLVLHLLQKNNSARSPYLLHGDCGVHNFIFNDGRLDGVIDPSPVIGPPLYDLIYAFCSSTDDLTKETIESTVSLLNKEDIYSSNLYAEVLIGLYLRIGTCIKHHPNDFGDYLNAWNYWKEVIKQP